MIFLGKIRVHELRKKISETIKKDIENKELIEKLLEFGIEVKSHSSSVEEKDAELILEYYVEENSPKKEEKADVEIASVSTVKKEDNKKEKKSKQNKKEDKKEKEVMQSENLENEDDDIKIIQLSLIHI